MSGKVCVEAAGNGLRLLAAKRKAPHGFGMHIRFVPPSNSPVTRSARHSKGPR